MKIVVTGAGGYIGSVLCDRLSKDGHNVIGFDKLMYDQGNGISSVFMRPNCRLYKEDVTLWSDHLKEELSSADVIIPLAALVGAPLCDRLPEEAVKINQTWTTELLNYLDKQKVIYPNTNSSYGSNPEICTETTPINPLSLYATTKQASESALSGYRHAVCFRLATVFGWSYRPRLDLLVNNLIYLAKTQPHIMLFDGKFRRNYIHIKDICDAFIYALDANLSGIYNLGNDSINSTKSDLVHKICKHYGTKVFIERSKTDPDKRNYEVSSQKLKDAGFQAWRSVDYGIEEMDRFLDIAGDISKCRNY